jgi:hypothetical protein
MPNYPPYQQPLVDRRGQVTKPWQLFFRLLTTGLEDALVDGSVSWVKLAPIPSPRLLGRGTPGDGPVEEILLGAGLTMTGTTLSASGGGGAATGYWTPITNGDAMSPELLFDATGACIVGFVPTA